MQYMNLNRFYTFENRRDAYNFDTSDVSGEDVILMRYLMMTNEGEVYSRQATSLIDEFGIIGGVQEIFVVLGFLLFSLIFKPFHDLDLAVKFGALKNRICIQENLIKEAQILDPRYKVDLDLRFYAFWFANKQLPEYFMSLCCLTNEKEDQDYMTKQPTYRQMADHFEEQENQVASLLSIRYAA